MMRKTWNPAALGLAGCLACCLTAWFAGSVARAQETVPLQRRVGGQPPPPLPPASRPADANQPTSGPAATEKGPWADAAVGMTVKLTLAGGIAQTRQIVKADANTVTIRTTVEVKGTKPVESIIPRLYTPEQLQQIMDGMGKKTGEETLHVGDKDFPCEIYDKVMVLSNRKVLTRTWLCKQVPGWSVRVDNDATGDTKTILQLVEFKTE
jgi:hypothetical protein